MNSANQHEAPFDLIVVGGGAAGLCHAFWRLRQQPDLRLLLLEAAPRVGGWVETTTVDGYQLETGPQGFRPEEASDAFVLACGLADRVVDCSASATRRFVVRGDRLHELPGGPGGLLTTQLFSLTGKLRLLWEPRVKTHSEPGETVAGFVTRRFGRQTRPLAEAMMHGIYAGDAHQLEVATTLPMVTDLEREHGSVLRGLGARRRQQNNHGAARPPARPTVCTFRAGMQASVDVIAQELGDRIRLQTTVEAVTGSAGDFRIRTRDAHGGEPTLQAREVCLTTPPASTAAMLRELDAELAGLLAEVPTVSVASSYIAFEATALPADFDGFGFLSPQGALGPVLGAIYTSRVFPHQAPQDRVLFRVMSGGFAFPDEVDRDDDDLARQATGLLQRYLGIERPPVFRHVLRARHAIPQYVRGHGDRMHAVAQRVATHRGLTLLGAGYRKVSVVGQWAEAGSAP